MTVHSSSFRPDVFTFPGARPGVHLETLLPHEVTERRLRNFIATAKEGIIAVAPAYNSSFCLVSIALASPAETLVISVSRRNKTKTNGSAKPSCWETISTLIFRNSNLTKVVFRSDKLAAALHLNLDLRVTQTVDLYSLSLKDFSSPLPILEMFYKDRELNLPALDSIFSSEHKNVEDVIPREAKQAWVACQIALRADRKDLDRLHRLDTVPLNKKVGPAVWGGLFEILMLKQYRPILTAHHKFVADSSTRRTIGWVKTNCDGK